MTCLEQPADERQLVEQCTHSEHAALKADRLYFFTGTTRAFVYNGQRFRNCLRCNSSLTIDPDPTEERS